ncbi:MAG: TlpA family protein disulfide reductase [Acidobacteria bacterium]|nr:TlpA family protein disulfide reductase [Acidobacteriota bacterium]MBI3471833.1 TlpA family protein disulfide reductase [Candidatus Solibacter usitatus]
MIVRILLLLVFASAAPAALVKDVRAAIAQNGFKQGEALIQSYRSYHGITPEMILALSWLGRGALAAKQLDQADSYAAETRKLALAQLHSRPLDVEKDLPLALGASIEVQAHVMDSRGRRSEAIGFLRRELATYHATSIRARIQKNIHLLSLAGRPAPPLELESYLGPRPEPLDRLKGKPVVLFFWAHWCSDCKAQAPILGRVAAKYASQGLAVIGPTQRYGYVAEGRDATPEQETPYIDEIRRRFYSVLDPMAVPVSEENFRNYGASTTPTLVLIDRKGLVRAYHPGAVSEDSLDAAVQSLVGK